MIKNNEYKFLFEGICPVDGGSDKYSATINTTGLIIVEDLLAYCEKQKEIPTFQEDWTRNIAEQFKCKVALLGYHRGGVRILSECEAS
jgi:NADPH-dependent 7-cyano-7-deazaguanine reductase QueF